MWVEVLGHRLGGSLGARGFGQLKVSCPQYNELFYLLSYCVWYHIPLDQVTLVRPPVSFFSKDVGQSIGSDTHAQPESKRSRR